MSALVYFCQGKLLTRNRLTQTYDCQILECLGRRQSSSLQSDVVHIPNIGIAHPHGTLSSSFRACRSARAINCNTTICGCHFTTTLPYQAKVPRHARSDIPKQMAHKGILHWRVWSPLAYLVDPDDACHVTDARDPESRTAGKSWGAGRRPIRRGRILFPKVY